MLKRLLDVVQVENRNILISDAFKPPTYVKTPFARNSTSNFQTLWHVLATYTRHTSLSKRIVNVVYVRNFETLWYVSVTYAARVNGFVIETSFARRSCPVSLTFWYVLNTYSTRRYQTFFARRWCTKIANVPIPFEHVIDTSWSKRLLHVVHARYH